MSLGGWCEAHKRFGIWRDLFPTTGQTLFFFRASERKTKNKNSSHRNLGKRVAVVMAHYSACGVVHLNSINNNCSSQERVYRAALGILGITFWERHASPLSPCGASGQQQPKAAASIDSCCSDPASFDRTERIIGS